MISYLQTEGEEPTPEAETTASEEKQEGDEGVENSEEEKTEEEKTEEGETSEEEKKEETDGPVLGQ